MRDSNEFRGSPPAAPGPATAEARCDLGAESTAAAAEEAGSGSPSSLHAVPIDPAPRQKGAVHHLPGDILIWLVILGELINFTAFFGLYGYYRFQDLALYRESQALLNVNYGGLNTLLLLISSYLVVTALTAARRGRGVLCSNLLGGAIAFGTAFSAVKLLEWNEKLSAGIHFDSNEFFTFYYVLTGIHLMHLLVGLGVLCWFCVTTRLGKVAAGDVNSLESGAIYWHMVDGIWIIIFPLLYLLP